MTTQLIKYEAACRALAECKSIDEAKSWTDKAAAMQAYGRMAKDRTLEVDAAEIRIRAERRLGEMLAATKADGGLNKDANLRRGPEVVSNDLGKKQAPTLADAGISKDLSSRAQRLAAVPAAEFEAELAAKRERDREDGARVSARLERAGEQALKQAKPQTAAQQAEQQRQEDAYGDTDPLELLEQLQADNERLTGELQATEADDLKAEALKWRRAYDSAARSQSEAMDRAAKYQKELDWHGRQLRRVGKAVGEEDPSKVAAVVEALVRSQKEAA